MTEQYLRHCRLILAGPSGGIDVSNLRIVFEVKKSDAQTPNSAVIRAYNLTQEIIQRARKEFQFVRLEAGYESNPGVIFSGNIKRLSVGRDGNTDTYLHIDAGDGDRDYVWSVTSTTIGAGATPAGQASTVLSKAEIPLRYNGLSNDRGLPRGKTLFGQTRDVMRRIVEADGSTWSIQDGAVQAIKRTSVLPGTAFKLTSKSGLIGVPELTNGGLECSVLLNPLIKIGTRVQIDDASIADTAITSDDSAVNNAPSRSADGFYRVLTVTHVGDTRGQEWYSNITCIDVDASAPSGREVSAL